VVNLAFSVQAGEKYNPVCLLPGRAVAVAAGAAAIQVLLHLFSTNAKPRRAAVYNGGYTRPVGFTGAGNCK
jgi:hypothetical protein